MKAHNSPSLLLSIDTATPCSSVALTSGTRNRGQVLASLCLNSKVTHSRRLLSLIDYLMKEAGVAWDRIEALAVSMGPGSFTGLRIGMATAKGLAFAAEKPMVGVSTLDGLASKCAPSQLICAVLDARKKEVYACFYRTAQDGLTVPVGSPLVISPERVAHQIDESVVFVGDAVSLYGDLWKSILEDKAHFASAHLHEPCASAIGLIGKEMLEAGYVLNIAEATPLYVRASDAELNLAQKKKMVK